MAVKLEQMILEESLMDKIDTRVQICSEIIFTQ